MFLLHSKLAWFCYDSWIDAKFVRDFRSECLNFKFF